MAEKIDLSSVDIVPLAKSMLKKAFKDEEPEAEFVHLINWLRTAALHSQLERKSKTYIALFEGELIAFLSISNGIAKVEGMPNTTKFEHQVLVIGKLYVSRKYRKSGLGKKLLNVALDIAVNIDEMTGCAGLIVDSNSNPNTINFYESFGFKPFEEQTDEDGRTFRMFFNITNL